MAFFGSQATRQPEFFRNLHGYHKLTGSLMSSHHSLQHSNNDLKLHWTVVGLTLTTVAAYLIFCHVAGEPWRIHLPEDQRVLIRTLFYVLAIIGFPVTNLLRHIQLRLNQTMPGPKPAKQRYLLTVIVSMGLAETVALMGLVIFLLGDDYNTLYIFTALSVLAVFLYRPKADEYREIMVALASREDDDD